MNKKFLYVSIIAIIVTFGIIFFSFYWPPVDKNATAGSFTKVDRYRKEQSNDKAILLRSEFISDSSVIAKSIKDLVAFGDFSLQLKKLIDQYWIPQLVKYNKAAEIQEGIEKLKDYSNFIQNNISTIQNTIEVLAGYYSKQNKDYSTDVESKIKLFYNYVSQLLVRDSLFEYTIAQIDNSIKSDKFRKTELSNIKALRDKMVIETLMYSTSIGDTAKIKYSANQIISNPKKLEETYNMIRSEMIIRNSENIGTFMNIPNGGIMNLVEQIRSSYGCYMLFSSDKIDAFMNFENIKMVSMYNTVDLVKAISAVNFVNGMPLLTSILNQLKVGLVFSNGHFNAINSNSNQAFMGNYQLGLFSHSNSCILNINHIYCAVNTVVE